MNYSIVIERPARKQLDKLDHQTYERIKTAINDLQTDPRPFGYAKMEGQEDLFRIRVGDWRVIYAIQDRKLIVLVVRVGHRSQVYR